MDHVFWTGMVATVLTAAAFFPQVIQAHRSRQTKDLSMVTLSMMACGVTLWMIYGILLGAIPLVVVNTILLVLSLDLIYLKKKYG